MKTLNTKDIKYNIIETIKSAGVKSKTLSSVLLYHLFNLMSIFIFFVSIFIYASISLIIIGLLYIGAFFNNISEEIENAKLK
tara:strand:+ start:575 stop:820 length:246 start_codon:yes stop_codon:yes gene_type:complete